MSLRIALLTNYPLVDNVEWKRDFISGCLARGYQIEVHYGKRNIKSMFKSYLIKRKYSSEVAKKVKVKSVKNVSFFKSMKIRVYKHKNINSDKAIESIQSGNYDIIVTALDQILSTKLLGRVNSNIVNVHYGALPEIKGTSALEWTYFKFKKCVASLHYIDQGIDTGEIIEKKEIEVTSPFSLLNQRKVLQERIPEMLFRYLLKVEEGNGVRTIKNKGGKLYTFMHPEFAKMLTN